MSTDLKSHLKERIGGWGKSYVNDLQAMTDDQLAKSPGGSSRTPFDITYEVIYVNKRVAARLRGEDPGPWLQSEGFLKAPQEFCKKDSAIQQLDDSVKAVLEGWEKTPPDKLEETIKVPTGETSPLDLVNLVATHLAYHDGQLNYHQT